jgi:hypothetical protein
MIDRSVALIALALAATAMPALAKDKDKDISGPPPPAFQAVIDCKALIDPASRLACYDKAVAAMDAARVSNDLVVADRATVREAKKGLFGLTLPRLKLFGDGGDDDVTEIESKITAIRVGQDRFPIFTLEDGARWKQTEGRDTFPKVGHTIRIRNGAMGGFLANVNNKPAIRVIRLAN